MIYYVLAFMAGVAVGVGGTLALPKFWKLIRNKRKPDGPVRKLELED